jgi:dTDP-4-dehydrorhamnose reductase
MRILVTGSNGLLGQKLTKRFQEDKDIYLIATARGRSALKIARGEYHSLDISNRDEVESILRFTKPDVIINTAAMTQVDDCETQQDACWKVNVTAVEHLVRCCQALHIHLIHLSTDFIFDGSHGPLDEDAQPNPVNYYGESKLESERIIRDSSTLWTIVRTVLVYGITSDISRSNIVLWVKDSLEQQKNIQVVNDQWRTPTLAEDLAEGCYLAARKRAKGIYNISGKDFLTPYDIAIRTAEFFKLDKSLISATDSNQFVQPARRPLKTGFIIDKARKELGYEAHSFEEGLAILAKQIE